MREVDPSKLLLLLAVMRDDNLANNGETFDVFGPLITVFATGPADMVQFT